MHPVCAAAHVIFLVHGRQLRAYDGDGAVGSRPDASWPDLTSAHTCLCNDDGHCVRFGAAVALLRQMLPACSDHHTENVHPPTTQVVWQAREVRHCYCMSGGAMATAMEAQQGECRFRGRRGGAQCVQGWVMDGSLRVCQQAAVCASKPVYHLVRTANFATVATGSSQEARRRHPTHPTLYPPCSPRAMSALLTNAGCRRAAAASASSSRSSSSRPVVHRPCAPSASRWAPAPTGSRGGRSGFRASDVDTCLIALVAG